MILRSYKDRKKLKALAKLTSRKDEDILEITEIGIELCIVDYALELVHVDPQQLTVVRDPRRWSHR